MNADKHAYLYKKHSMASKSIHIDNAMIKVTTQLLIMLSGLYNIVVSWNFFMYFEPLAKVVPQKSGTKNR